MRARIIGSILTLLEKLTGKRFLYYTPSETNGLGMTAVWSKFGFWYTGNVYDPNDIAYGIAQNGQVEPEETALVNRILSTFTRDKTPVVYDIGANTGYYSILAASVHSARVYSFEPLLEHLTCLSSSSRLNGIEDHITTYQIALSDADEERDFYLGGSGSSLDPLFLGNASAKHIKVRSVQLDALREEEGMEHPDFVKIDVEGSEYAVLRGAIETIQTALPVLFIEIASTLRTLSRGFIHQDYEKIFELLSGLGYKSFILDGDLRQVSAEDRRDGVHMYLFLATQNPSHRPLLATLGNT